jgi:predicted DNA-binding transcriptional regulator YafY
MPGLDRVPLAYGRWGSGRSVRFRSRVLFPVGARAGWYAEAVRGARLVSLLLLLQVRGRMTAAQLARELEVSERTIYRDLAHLSGAGVPVIGARGEAGGYRLLDGYRTNLTGLTEREAEGLLLLGVAGPLADLGLAGVAEAARLKVLAAVPPGLRAVAVRADQRFLLDPAGWAHADPSDPPHLAAAAGATWRDRKLRIAHRRPDGRQSRRVLDPLGVVHKTGTWYLVAADRGSPRVYRIDRILAADELVQPAERPPGFDLAAFWSSWQKEFAAGLPTLQVRARLGPMAARYLRALGTASPRSASAGPADTDGWKVHDLVFDDERVACAGLLALAPEVEVLEPADVRLALVSLADAIAARNRSDLDRDGGGAPKRRRDGSRRHPATGP